MIPAIGLMIGLYILARYGEMSKTAGAGSKVMLAIFSLITIVCLFSLFMSSVTSSSYLR